MSDFHTGDKPRDKGLAELDRQEAAEAMPKLNPKDRVRVTFDAYYEDVEIAMWHNTPLMKLATLEVLARADDIPDEAWAAAAAVNTAAGLGFPDVSRDAIRAAIAAAHPPVPVGGEVERAQQQRQRKRRVFLADGPYGVVEEPPDWVGKVEDKHGDCLKREGDGWIGYGGDGYPLMVKPWEDHVLPKYAPYTEVSL